jgi:hypothetical protein
MSTPVAALRASSQAMMAPPASSWMAGNSWNPARHGEAVGGPVRIHDARCQHALGVDVATLAPGRVSIQVTIAPPAPSGSRVALLLPRIAHTGVPLAGQAGSTAPDASVLSVEIEIDRAAADVLPRRWRHRRRRARCAA